MTLQTNFILEDNVAIITLSGRLDSVTTPHFKNEIEKAINGKVKELVLLVKDLEYMSSSGLRVLIFYKQKMGSHVGITVVSPNPFIREILEMTGFQYGVTIVDDYNVSKTPKDDVSKGNQGKIGVLIEEHFDATEYRRFNEYFPIHGYEVEYISHLWNNPQLVFGSNPENDQIEFHAIVKKEVNNVNPTDYKGFILIGAYAMDRLRYEEHPIKGRPNQAPAVCFLRKISKISGLKIGTICHSLWLFCADPELLKGRKVTCAHNIISDVQNAGGDVQFEGDQTKDIVVDGDLISGKHPGVLDEFMRIYLQEIKAASLRKEGL